MIDEAAEFLAYTVQPEYRAEGKRDTAYLGRFTFDMLMDFEGMARVLTILARGYMWQTGKADAGRARAALLAWCSLPDSKKAAPREEWQYKTSWAEKQEKFPELVDSTGSGWFYRHVHCICRFVKENPALTSKTAQEKCALLEKGFDDAWRKKVLQLQTPIFSPGTKGAWVLRFDDALAEAKELGPLRNPEITIPGELRKRIAEEMPDNVPLEAVELLVKYYLANRPEDSDWVVLPVTNVDAWFGNTSFSRKWLAKMPESLILREKQEYGICRYKLLYS